MISVKVIASSSKGNCYLIDDGHTRLILELGIAWKGIQKALNFRTSSVAAAFVSHEHGDHSKAVNHAAKTGLDIYMSAGTAKAINASGHNIKTLRAGHRVQVDSWRVLSFGIEHDAAEPLGFLFTNGVGEKLLFITDTAYVRYKFSGINYLMIECNFSKEILDRNIAEGRVDHSRRSRLLQSHMSLERVIDLIEANDMGKTLQKVWLMHLSDANSDEAMFKQEIQQLAGVPVVVC